MTPLIIEVLSVEINPKKKANIMKIIEALQESAKDQDAIRFERLINLMDRKGMDVMVIPFLCDVNRVGIKTHRWAWDQLEDWQNAE